MSVFQHDEMKYYIFVCGRLGISCATGTLGLKRLSENNAADQCASASRIRPFARPFSTIWPRPPSSAPDTRCRHPKCWPLSVTRTQRTSLPDPSDLNSDEYRVLAGCSVTSAVR